MRLRRGESYRQWVVLHCGEGGRLDVEVRSSMVNDEVYLFVDHGSLDMRMLK